MLACDYPLSCGQIGVNIRFLWFQMAIPRNWLTELEIEFDILSFWVKINNDVKNQENQRR